MGSAAWDRLFGDPRPQDLHPFQELEGPRHRAVSTPGDLLFHIRAARTDLCFALVAEIMKRLRDAVTVQDEVQAFGYFDSRNLLGFVDGTENPVGQAAAESQEKVIGRSELTNIELDVPGSHKDVNTVTGPDGEEPEILRGAMPFGRPGHGEFGTYFIAYARTPEVPETMMRTMFLGGPESGPDPILDYSQAVTGTLFFVPSVTFLESTPERSATDRTGRRRSEPRA